MKCLYCNKEIAPGNGLGRPKKYCDEKCRREVDKENKRIKYVGKRQEFCEACGKTLPKYKSKYCSKRCYINKKPIIQKICVICGNEFETYREEVVTCSKECSKTKGNIREQIRYRNNHPGAKSMDEIHETSKKRKETKRKEVEERKAKRDLKLKKARDKKAKEKQKNIDHWINYCQLHECAECGQMYVAHYPLSKYCSEKCSRARNKKKKRYEGITVDKGITLKRLAKRDSNICALCGQAVDWNDYIIKDSKTVICGDLYPSIDHVKPISKGGLHSWDNIQLAHRKCNTLKCDKEQVT